MFRDISHFRIGLAQDHSCATRDTNYLPVPNIRDVCVRIFGSVHEAGVGVVGDTRYVGYGNGHHRLNDAAVVTDALACACEVTNAQAKRVCTRSTLSW